MSGPNVAVIAVGAVVVIGLVVFALGAGGGAVVESTTPDFGGIDGGNGGERADFGTGATPVDSNSVALAFPNPPTITSVTRQDANTIAVTWTAPTTGVTPTQYRLVASTDPNFSEVALALNVTVTGLTYAFTAPPYANTLLYFRCISVSASATATAGEKLESAPSAVVTFDTTLPLPPTAVATSAYTQSGFTATWTPAPTAVVPVRYVAQLSKTSDFATIYMQGVVDGRTNTHVFTDVYPNNYSLRVYAEGPNYKLSAASATVAVLSTAFLGGGPGTIQPPTGVTMVLNRNYYDAATNTKYAAFTWTPPQAGPPASAYNIEVKDYNDAGTTQLSVRLISNISFTAFGTDARTLPRAVTVRGFPMSSKTFTIAVQSIGADGTVSEWSEPLVVFVK